MWPNPQETADLVTFTEEILNVKRYFCIVIDWGSIFEIFPHVSINAVLPVNVYIVLVLFFL